MEHPDSKSSFASSLRIELALLVGFVSVLCLNLLGVIPEAWRMYVVVSVVLLGLIPVAKSARESIRKRQINVDLLALIALVFSLVAQEWNSTLFISLMLTSARIFGLYTERRVKKSLESLLKLKPSKARVLRGETAAEIPLSEVRIGDLVVVNLGEQIPVDGIVFKGSATVDQSSLTGESIPVLKSEGGAVLSATVVMSGNITVRTQKIGSQTTFEQMIALVESSQEAKTKMKTIAERFASWYIGIMLLVSIVLFMWTHDIKLVLAVVLVVCADDIAIAIPLAYIAAIGAAARRGIIIKSADFLEGAARITTLVVDKTGTLTLGNLSVKRVETFEGNTLPKTLELSGIICHGSTHPVAKAIARYTAEHHITCVEPDHFKETEGRGIRGVAMGKEIIIGRMEFIQENNIAFSDRVFAITKEEEEKGRNVTLVAYEKNIVGLFSLADELRPGIATTIRALKKTGIKETVMLTGDNESVAHEVAQETGIDEYYAKLLPEKKVSILGHYLGTGKTVAMVGDGVNDAAVLSRADIGIAMGGIGSDAAIESADIVLMQDDFGKLVELRNLSRKVLFVARSNFAFWAIINSIGLYFVFTGAFDPSRAALYNFITDFIPIANSLRLFRYRG